MNPSGSEVDARKHQWSGRFSESAKFLPVGFVVANILGLWIIYNFFHVLPLIQDPASRARGITLLVIFNLDTCLLWICYLRCILVHPGSIPDRDEDQSWEYVPADGRATDGAALNLQESKRSGDRRHCKWCAKYKPDRCHHCRVCRMCILKMDHHCPWIYNCVGFRNHKFFFLLLFYTVIAVHLITWTMLETVKDSVSADTPFMKMFLVLFGETLAAFIGVLVTVFFCFHIWLVLKAMTTIEFCEKSMKRTGYDTSIYDLGFWGNIQSVLGDNVLLWLLPVNPPTGNGLKFANAGQPEDQPLVGKDLEAGRKSKAKKRYGSTSSSRDRRGAGTGSAPDCSEVESSAGSEAPDRDQLVA